VCVHAVQLPGMQNLQPRKTAMMQTIAKLTSALLIVAGRAVLPS
jgi:hypothetical protein